MLLKLGADKLMGVEFDKSATENAVELRETLTSLGPTFIKVGQAVSIRPDILPLNVMQEL